MFQLLTIIFTLVSLINSTFHDAKQVAVYWGQASKEELQMSLSYYCESDSIDIVILAFVSEFGKKYTNVRETEGLDDDELNGNNLDKDKFGSFILDLSSFCVFSNIVNAYKCPSLVQDIKTCQALRKKVLISFGGEHIPGTKQTYGFIDDEEAKDFAQVLWNTFGEGDTLEIQRPFGDAIVDGFDIDIENEDQIGYVSMITELNKLAIEQGTKKYFFSSAPQCDFPDKSNSDLIDNFELDYVFVQFYNNDCQLNQEDFFNFKQWSDYIDQLGYTKTKIFVGLPASLKAASLGFIKDESEVVTKIVEIESNQDLNKNFGGLMFWDASKGFDHSHRDSSEKSYIFKIWAILTNFLKDPDASSDFQDSSNTISNGATHEGDSNQDTYTNGSKPTPRFNNPSSKSDAISLKFDNTGKFICQLILLGLKHCLFLFYLYINS